jgi:hypothetical protein
MEPGTCIGPVETRPSLEGPQVCLLRHVSCLLRVVQHERQSLDQAADVDLP